MTTAELIKKRQEEKDKPLKENPTSFTSMTTKPDPSNIEGMKTSGDDSVNQQVAQDLNHAYEIERQIDANEGKQGAVKVSQAGKEALMQRPDDAISLYEIGKNTAGIKSVKDMAASPLKTPEYDDFRKQVIGEKHFGVESEEDAAKRERRDYIRQGLTGLTEGLSALANLYYTTKWAPNQKFNSQMPALQQRLYQERIERDKKLENFRNWQRGEAAKDAERAFQEKLFNKRQQAANKAAEREWEYKADQAKENLRRWKAEFDAAEKRHASDAELKRIKLEMDKAQQEFDNNYRKQTLAETQRHNKAMEYNASIKNNNSGTGSKKNTKIAVIDTPKGPMDVDFGKVNESTLNQLYKKVPEEIKEQYEPDMLDDEKTRQNKMRQAIDRALLEDESMADWLEDAGVGVYQNKPKNEGQATSQANTKAVEDTEDKYGKYDTASQSSSSKTGGEIDFSKAIRAKTGSQSTGANAETQVTDTQTANGSAPVSQFESFFSQVEKEKADKATAKERKMQENIAEKESQIKQTRDTLNTYMQELDSLMKATIPHVENERKKRGLSASQTRDLQRMVNDTVKRKEFLQKEIKELQAKEKILNKEYEKLYPYKTTK